MVTAHPGNGVLIGDMMMKDWLAKHPDVRTIRVAAADLNGQAARQARARPLCRKRGDRRDPLPVSVLNLDIWGEDIDDSPWSSNRAMPTAC
jgi:glutamine synthetase